MNDEPIPTEPSTPSEPPQTPSDPNAPRTRRRRRRGGRHHRRRSAGAPLTNGGQELEASALPPALPSEGGTIPFMGGPELSPTPAPSLELATATSGAAATGTEAPGRPKRRRRGGRRHRRSGSGTSVPGATANVGAAVGPTTNPEPELALPPMVETAPAPVSEAPEPTEDEIVSEGPAPARVVVTPRVPELSYRTHLQAPVIGLKQLRSPGIDPAKARTLMVQFVRDGLERSGTRTAVVGLQGDLDSAVVAALAVEALGAAQVLAVFMIDSEPTFGDRSNVELIGRNLGCKLETVDARVWLKPLWESAAITWTPERVRQRVEQERTTLLTTLAEQRSAVVIAALNKSRRLLGYAAPYGDGTGALNPLGDCYQSQAVELARALRVPNQIVDRGGNTLPLKPGDDPQVTHWKWREIDFLLHQIVDVRLSLAHLFSLGLDTAKLRWVYRALRAAAAHPAGTPLVRLNEAYQARSTEGLVPVNQEA